MAGWEEEKTLQQIKLKKWSHIWEKSKICSLPHTVQKQITLDGLNCQKEKLKNIKLRFQILNLMKNIDKYLLDLGAGKGFSNKTQ